VLEPIRLPGVPLADPAWSAARRGRPAANAGLVFPPEVLTASEVGALMRACNPRTPSGCRNRAMLATLWRGGLRVGELVGRVHRTTGQRFPGISTRDLRLDEGLIRVTYGKGNRRQPFKSRTVAIDQGAVAFLELWLAKRRELEIPSRVQLFCTISADEDRYGGLWRPLSPTYVRSLLKRLGRGAGIEKRVHPHALRHTMAFEWAMAGVPAHVVQAQLGHSSLAVTGRYLAHIAPALLVDAARGVPWPEQVQAAHVLPSAA
jgi:site-specific recombinase XerD